MRYRQAVGGCLGCSARAVRRGWLAWVGGRRRRTAVPANSPVRATWCRRQAQGSGRLGPIGGSGKGMLAGLALVFAALQPADGRPLARPAVRSRLRRRRAPSPPGPVVYKRFLVAVLRILGVRSSPSSPSVPPGPAVQKFPSGAPASLISSGNFPHLALRVDSPPSAAEQASLPATKKQRGREGELAGHHELPHPPHFSDKKEHHHE